MAFRFIFYLVTNTFQLTFMRWIANSELYCESQKLHRESAFSPVSNFDDSRLPRQSLWCVYKTGLSSCSHLDIFRSLTFPKSTEANKSDNIFPLSHWHGMASDTSTVEQSPQGQELVEIRIEPDGKVFRVSMDLLLARIPKLMSPLTDSDSITISAEDENTVAVLLHWLAHGTLPKLEPKMSDDVLDSWNWNPFYVYNLAIMLDLDEVQDRVMTRLLNAIRKKQLEIKKDWLVSHWDANKIARRKPQYQKLLENESDELEDPNADPDAWISRFNTLSGTEYQPNYPSVAMIQAIFTQAPPNTAMKNLALDFMNYVVFEGRRRRARDWETENVIRFLTKDEGLLRATVVALRNTHDYFEWRNQWVIRGPHNPTDNRSSWGRANRCTYHKHKWAAKCPYKD
ncbi:uncharacterized protein PAC_17014 [Phialocephala subalpina]|uniref:BTB domain-containing protein n=1 Tax=Phialocephala subalpina TaxID=576137 RepID=A0A1L7XQ30_9HELO|nr:uncharacterized protein PAC_17014 [Phialocephala subalpina]